MGAAVSYLEENYTQALLKPMADLTYLMLAKINYIHPETQDEVDANLSFDLIEMSAGGMRISCRQPLPRNTLVKLQFINERTGEEYALLGCIRWVKYANKNTYSKGIEIL